VTGRTASRTCYPAISLPRRPGQKLIGDITYIPTWRGWLFLATVIDCHTREVIGWAMDDHYRTPLIEKAITMASRNHRLADDVISIPIAAATTRPPTMASP
jgi:transposase InsO family protein